MLSDVEKVVESDVKPGRKGKAGIVKHYGVFTEVTDAKLADGVEDTWTHVAKVFKLSGPRPLVEAIVSFAETPTTSTSYKLGEYMLVCFPMADYLDLIKLIQARK